MYWRRKQNHFYLLAKKVSPANDAKWFSSDHDFILVYAKNKDIWRQKA
jgi:adenine specific DNA methylase Mod